MRKQLFVPGPLLALALLAAPGCTDGPPASDTSTTGAGGSGAGGETGGAAGTGGSGGEPLPPLDPAACPVTAGSGEDPAVVEAAEAQWSPTFALPQSTSIQQDKAFFLATLLSADPALVAGLAADPALSAISQAREDAFRAAPDTCAADVACHAAALQWSETDTQSAAAALTAHLDSTGKLAPFAADMRASGRFALHATLADHQLVDTAFRDLVTALGKTFSDEAGSLGGNGIQSVVDSVAAAHPEPLLFFEPLLLVDLAALTADERDEAARYEPLAEGENAAAVAHIPSIEWPDYPFTVIVVPGLGPTKPDVPLSAGGQARCDLAAQRFAAGIAPLIALSGGHVHPDRTPYSEAIEMKKYLLAAHGIPEEALLVDPHARHTTTNLRNVTRLLYRYGVPTDRAALVTTDFGQSLYIAYWDGMFGPRCEEELGYLPWQSLVPLSQNDTCWRPTAISLHADGRDRLDP
jgi:hypothetical protein